MPEKKPATRTPLSLYPLKFDDALTALLKTKPEPKEPTKKQAKKHGVRKK